MMLILLPKQCIMHTRNTYTMKKMSLYTSANKYFTSLQTNFINPAKHAAKPYITYAYKYIFANKPEFVNYAIIFSSGFVGQVLQQRTIRALASTANYFFNNRDMAFTSENMRNSGLRSLAISFAIFYIHQLAHEYFKKYAENTLYSVEKDHFHTTLDDIESKNGLIYYQEKTGLPFPTQTLLNGLQYRSNFKIELASSLGCWLSYLFVRDLRTHVTGLIQTLNPSKLTREDIICTIIMVLPMILPAIQQQIAFQINAMLVEDKQFRGNRAIPTTATADNASDLTYRTNAPLITNNARLADILAQKNADLRTSEEKSRLIDLFSIEGTRIGEHLSNRFFTIPTTAIAFRLFAESSMTQGEFMAVSMLQTSGISILFKIPQLITDYVNNNNVMSFTRYLIERGYKPATSGADNNNIAIDKLRIIVPGENDYANDKLRLRADKLNFEKGKVYSLVGESGAGKTTFCKALVGLTGFTTRSSIRIDDQAKDKVYFVSQDGLANLPGILTVREILTSGHNDDTLDLTDGKIRTILGSLDLGKFSVNLSGLVKNPSGGEQIRLLMAKAILGGAKIIIIDEGLEKTSAIGHDGQQQTDRERYQQTLQSYARNNGATILSIEHTPSNWADKIVRFSKNATNSVSVNIFALVAKDTNVAAVVEDRERKPPSSSWGWFLRL